MEKYIAQSKAHHEKQMRQQWSKSVRKVPIIPPEYFYDYEQNLLAIHRCQNMFPNFPNIQYKWLEDLNIDTTVWNDKKTSWVDKEEMILQAMGLTL